MRYIVAIFAVAALLGCTLPSGKPIESMVFDPPSLEMFERVLNRHDYYVSTDNSINDLERFVILDESWKLRVVAGLAERVIEGTVP